MERKIGDIFEYEGEKLKVVNAGTACDGCYFKGKSCDNRNYDITGICGWTRKDNQPVRFIKVNEEQQDEQPQPQEKPQKLNLCEVLKDCPTGTVFYSTLHGKVNFVGIDEEKHPIIFMFTDKGIEFTSRVSSEGKYLYTTIGECILFPSKEQRDWSKFTAPWLKKERFNPKTLKPFDRVLVRDKAEHTWYCDFFSHIVEKNLFCKYAAISAAYRCCIPYNDDTKNLIGTTDEAPEYYRYWED